MIFFKRSTQILACESCGTRQKLAGSFDELDELCATIDRFAVEHSGNPCRGLVIAGYYDPRRREMQRIRRMSDRRRRSA